MPDEEKSRQPRYGYDLCHRGLRPPSREKGKLAIQSDKQYSQYY